MKAGITGHRDLGGAENAAWARARLESAINDLDIDEGLTSLAIGADQLFADVLRVRHIPYTAVIPSDGYETTFTVHERKRYIALRGDAAGVVQLPFSEPSEAAYMTAGKTIVDVADVIIAVWNGKPARGHGGTADVVNYAMAQAKPIFHINPETRTVHELRREEDMATSTLRRVFISFAIEDQWQRTALVGQAKNENSPFEFVDMSVKEPWDEKWKTNCRTKIKGCDGVIVLISKNTAKAAGAKWEIKCAKDENIPIVGMYAYSDDRSTAPTELGSTRVMTWTWDNIKTFIDGL